jgi:hypothetical protein
VLVAPIRDRQHDAVALPVAVGERQGLVVGLVDDALQVRARRNRHDAAIDLPVTEVGGDDRGQRGSLLQLGQEGAGRHEQGQARQARHDGREHDGPQQVSLHVSAA